MSVGSRGNDTTLVGGDLKGELGVRGLRLMKLTILRIEGGNIQ
jgi:hypothetical protein